MHDPASDTPQSVSQLCAEFAGADEKTAFRFIDFLRNVPAAGLILSDERILHYARRWVAVDDGLAGQIAREDLLAEILREFPPQPKHYRAAAAHVKLNVQRLESLAEQIESFPLADGPLRSVADDVRGIFELCHIFRDPDLPRAPFDLEMSISQARTILLDLAQRLSHRAKKLEEENSANPSRDAQRVSNTQSTDFPVPDYIDLDQAAALVNRVKKTLERAVKNDPSMPRPDIEGGGGKKNEWDYAKLKPWLETKYGRKLPARPPHVIR